MLETLDLEFHSIGILAVLNAKLVSTISGNLNSENFKPLISQIQEFIIGCNKDQIQLVLDLCK